MLRKNIELRSHFSIPSESVKYQFVFTSLCSSLVLRGKPANSVLGLVWSDSASVILTDCIVATDGAGAENAAVPVVVEEQKVVVETDSSAS